MASMRVRYFSLVAPVARARRRQRTSEKLGANVSSTRPSVVCNGKPLRALREFLQHVLPFRPGDESGHSVRAVRSCSRWMRPVCSALSSTASVRATILQLLIEINRRRRQKNHHRAFNGVIFLRHHLARRRVFAGAGYR